MGLAATPIHACTSPAKVGSAQDTSDSTTEDQTAKPDTTQEVEDTPSSESSKSTSQETDDQSQESPGDTKQKSPEASKEGGTGGTDPEKPGDTSTSDGSKTEEGETPEPEAECVDNAKRQCAETEAGIEIQFPGGIARGSCRYGEQTCKDGKWQACQGAVGPKNSDTCDAGNDDNCNGVPNDHCACTAGETRPCGSDVGACQKGVVTCGADGKWGNDCAGEIAPTKEICDGRFDENCDGKPDEENCECLNDQASTCPLTGLGDCALGARTCNSGEWSQCKARFPRQQERCGLPREDRFGSAVGDEDCDGETNNTALHRKAPINCQQYMVDDDEDGYGARGPSASQVRTGYTHGCFCPENAPKGNFVRDLQNRSNSDCGDCPGTGVEVFPRKGGEYYKKPNACLKSERWPGGAFDYNCDEKQEQEHSTQGQCVQQSSMCVDKPGYWINKVPSCGELGRKYTWCESETPDDSNPNEPCRPMVSMEQETQRCR